MSDLKLGFPNKLHVKMVKKHGWGVRDDHQSMMLPLVPTAIKRILSSKGIKRIVLRFFHI